MSATLDITRPAMARSRLTLLLSFLLVAVGLIMALDFPSSEEPSISIRTGVVAASVPGLSTERMERLVAVPIEGAIRETAEVKRVETLIRPGVVISYVTLEDSVAPDQLSVVFQRMRTRMADLQPMLPVGTLGPTVDDEFGRTAVLVLAISGPDFSRADLNAQARALRDRLTLVPGAEKASIHGQVGEEITLALDFGRMRQSGLSPADVLGQLATQNIVRTGGDAALDGMALSVEVTGDVPTAEAFSDIEIRLPSGGAIRLGEFAEVVRKPVEQPETAAVFNGMDAVVVAVSMQKGISIQSFSERLMAAVEASQAELPVGMLIDIVSDQAEVVAHDIAKVGTVFLETVGIVMAVVVMFLGFRSGLIVGVIVPLTMLASLVVMRMMEIELHSISIAALIIALGLLVDNGIVIVEDVERRLAAGEDREQACIEAGRTLSIPLLVSCLAIILAFLPLVLSQSSVGEYMRSLGQVVAITLLISWVFSLTVVPILCRRFARAHAAGHEVKDSHDTLFFRGYRRLLTLALKGRVVYLALMLGLLAFAVWELGRIPQSLLPPSARPAIQVPVEFAPGTNTATTLATATRIGEWLADRQANPEVTHSAIYVGDGGPRFILGLNPPFPAPHRAYAIVSLTDDSDPAAVIDRLRRELPERFPEGRFDPKRFSLGSGDAGAAVFRIVGPDLDVLRKAAGDLSTALGAMPGIDAVRSDDEGMIGRVMVEIDQARARAVGLSSDDVAVALRALTSGEPVSVFRDGDQLIPVTIRDAAPDRRDPAYLGSLSVFTEDGATSALLGQIADTRFEPQDSVIQRRDGVRQIIVTARGAALTATEIAAMAEPAIDALALVPGHVVQLGGEIEDNADLAAALGGLLPLCVGGMFALFVWQFNSLRQAIIIMASIPFGVIGVTLGLWLAGATLSFTAILGILALSGIIVNNAILLLERIHVEEVEGRPRTEAILEASVKRLRPIIMTKLVCILGLVPLMLFGGDLWYPMAAGMIGGLLLGTLITLGLVPVVYSLLYGRGTAVPAASDAT